MRWGARAKVEDIETRYSEILMETTAAEESTVDTRPHSVKTDLDLASVVKASQAISSEIEMENLLTRLMGIVMENDGAQKGFLILENNSGNLVVEAHVSDDSGQAPVLASMPVETCEILSKSIVYYTFRTGENVVLNNAAGQGDFILDPYIRSHRPLSILCIPIMRKGEATGVLYLENNLATDIFTPARVKVLSLLSSQAAITIETAKLYGGLKASEDRLEDLVKQRTIELSNTNQQLEKEIAERVLTEEALRESEKRYRTLFETSPDFLCTISPADGTITSLNPAFEKITGWPISEWLGRSYAEFIHPEDLSMADAKFVQVLSGDTTPPFEFEVVSEPYD